MRAYNIENIVLIITVGIHKWSENSLEGAAYKRGGRAEEVKGGR